MKVLVTGGTGNLGSHIVAELTKQNDLQVRIMTLTAPHEKAALGTEWAQADLGNEGDVARAVQGIDLIIHAASDYIVDPAHSDVRATGLLLRQANAAGVKHFCYVSIVGNDRVPLPYYGAKVQCEASVRDNGLSWSIFGRRSFIPLWTR